MIGGGGARRAGGEAGRGECHPVARRRREMCTRAGLHVAAATWNVDGGNEFLGFSSDDKVSCMKLSSYLADGRLASHFLGGAIRSAAAATGGRVHCTRRVCPCLPARPFSVCLAFSPYGERRDRRSPGRPIIRSTSRTGGRGLELEESEGCLPSRIPCDGTHRG